MPLPVGTLVVTYNDAKIWIPAGEAGWGDRDLEANLLFERLLGTVMGNSWATDLTGFSYVFVLFPMGIRVVREDDLDTVQDGDTRDMI